jgi:hypothetical protein
MSGMKIHVRKRDGQWCVYLPFDARYPHAGPFDAYQSWSAAVNVGVPNALDWVHRHGGHVG